MRKIVLDFETASACNLKDAGAWRYSEDVTTEVISLSYSIDGQGPYTWEPGLIQGENYIAGIEVLARFHDTIFIAHNAGFEKAIWRNIMVAQYGWTDIPDHRWEDTAAICAMRALPINLDKATLALRLHNHKDKEGSKITRQLSKANRKGFYTRDPAILERVYEYNRQDVRATEELYKRLGSLPPDEHQVWLLDQKINQRGIGIDRPFIEAADTIVKKASLPLVEEFQDITGGLKPSQNAKVKAWVNANGVNLDSLNKEIVSELLGQESEEEDDNFISDEGDFNLPELPNNVRRALVIRSIVGSASVKKLARMRQCVCFDGRVRGTMQYHGAGPGRWAGRLFQPHNFPRGTIKDNSGEKPHAEVMVAAIMSGDPLFVEATIGEPIEVVVSSLRHAILAAQGHELLSGDFAQIEARFVLALAGQHDKTAILANGGSVYCDMGQTIYSRPIDKKKDTEEYQIGKNSVLGLGFQMGWRKFKLKYAKDKSDEFCQRVVEAYREEWAPCVPKVWYGLEDAAVNTVHKCKPHVAFGVEYRLEDGFLTARLPSGRKLWYFNPQPTRRAMPWDETIVKPSFNYQQMKKGQLATIDAFGGLLTENVIQGLARDLMVNRMFALESHGFPLILTVHDEIVAEPEKINADELAFRQIMQESPRWVKELNVPVAVETWKADRYRK